MPHMIVPSGITTILVGMQVFLVSGLVQRGCSGPEAPPTRVPVELRVPLPRPIGTLDPAEGEDIATSNVIRQLYECLVDYDPHTLEVVPRIARSWSVHENGLEWRFELNREVYFIDDPCFPSGQRREVTAEDAKYSIERGLRAYRRDGGHADLPAIVGLPEFLTGEAEQIRGISAPSPTTLVIRLDRVDPSLLHLLARTRCRIVPREAVETYGDQLSVRAVGTGPFRLVSWESVSGILLVRNRGYWQRDEGGTPLPYVDALRFIPGWLANRNRLFAKGKLDMIHSYARALGSSPGAFIVERVGLYTGGGEQELVVPRLNTIYVGFDYRSPHPVVQNRNLRRALICATLRPTRTICVPAKGLFPPGLPGYDPGLEGQATDLAKAKALLHEAGYPGGEGLPEVRIAWRQWDEGFGKGLANSLRRLGIQVDLKFYDDQDYWKVIEARGADFFRAGWIADYPDPQTFVQLFYSGASENAGFYSDPEYDRLFERFRVEPDPDLRLSLAGRMERILIEDEAAIFFLHETERQYVSPRVENWVPNCSNPLNVCFYERVRVKPRGRSTLP